MSTMLVSDKTIEKIYNSGNLFSQACFNRTFYTDELYKEFKLINELNIESYCLRYPQEFNKFEVINFSTVGNFRFTEGFKNHSELLKALHCLHYNIDFEEKDILVYDKKLALKNLETYIKNITNHIVFNLEEYKEASWG